jgi:hypothetical protein
VNASDENVFVIAGRALELGLDWDRGDRWALCVCLGGRHGREDVWTPWRQTRALALRDRDLIPGQWHGHPVTRCNVIVHTAAQEASDE